MYKKLLFAAALLAIIFIIAVVQRIPSSSAAPAGSPSDQEAQMAPPAQPVDTSTAIESNPEQVSSSGDGATLVTRYCTQCHPAQLLDGAKQSRENWDTSLAKMESMGVRIDSADRAVLLDYLAATYQP